MKEYQIVVNRIATGSLCYLAQYRKVHFLWRGQWTNITPAYRQTMEEAEEQIRKHYIESL